MSRKHIWILGDSPLVEEYAALCVDKGFETKVRLNRDGTTKDLPRGVQQYHETDREVDLVFELTNLSADIKRRTLVQLDSVLPPLRPIISSSVTISVEEQASWLEHPFRLIGIGALPTLSHGSMIEFASSHATDNATRSEASHFATAVGKTAAFVNDSVGMVTSRILCSLVNEACFALTEGVAEAKEIDTAMKLGTNYPHGPLEWGERITPRHVHAVVAAMHKYFGDDRYRPAPFLQKAAFKNSFRT